MKKIITILLILMSFTDVISAQTVKDSGYRTVGYIKSNGTVQDASYRTIGYAKGIPLKWAAFYFFFQQ